MKILHVVPSYIPAYRYGGPVKAVHELSKALVKKGLEITVFTTNIDWEGNLDIPVNEPQYVEGVKVFYYPVKHMRSYCYSRKFSLAIKKHIREFDLVHIHSVYLYPTFIAAHWCRKYKKPYIINPFGGLDLSMIELKSRIKKIFYIKLFERRNIRKARVIHVASGPEKRKILSLGFDVPVITIPRGIELKEYERSESPLDLRERYPELKGKKIVLFLGRIHQKKGFDLLAPAFREIMKNRKDVYLIIAGTGENGYVNKVKKLFSKEGIIEKIIFTGMLLGPEKLSAFYSSDIFVLPSYRENFGIAILEAMACRLPVIITNRVGLCHSVEEYKAGIITDCKSDKIADAILKLLCNEDLRKTTGENGRKLVEDRFTSDRVADKMIGVYKEILEK